MTSSVCWLVGDDVECAGIARAGVAALDPRNARVISGGELAEARDALVLVFAADLERYLEQIPSIDRRTRAERTIVVNAERHEVLDLLERHELGGAIECEDHEAWAAYEAETLALLPARLGKEVFLREIVGPGSSR